MSSNILAMRDIFYIFGPAYPCAICVNHSCKNCHIFLFFRFSITIFYIHLFYPYRSFKHSNWWCVTNYVTRKI